MFRVPSYQPNLIDLGDYLGELLIQRDTGIVLRPPPMIPNRLGGWSEDEMKSMQRNRRAAQEIYERVRDGR